MDPRTYPAIVVAVRPPEGVPLTDLVAAVLDGYGVTALDEPDTETVRAYFGETASRDAALAALRAALPAASAHAADISDENWAERSQANLRAIEAGALTIAPPWDAPEGANACTIVILPAMGFGTGHHATTRLCLLALQRAGVEGKSVVDVGTGSGVLAIAARRLGAARAVGIDNDQDAIDNALENRALNGADVDFRCVRLEDASLAGPFDIVVANLTGATLIRFAPELSALTADGGRMILSGLREEEEGSVRAAFDRALISRDAEDGWVCLVLG